MFTDYHHNIHYSKYRIIETIRTNVENFIKNDDLQNAIYLLIENTSTNEHAITYALYWENSPEQNMIGTLLSMTTIIEPVLDTLKVSNTFLPLLNYAI